MKRINLTQNKVAIVDDQDYDWLSRRKWYAHKGTHGYYAVRNSKKCEGKKHLIRMHRAIMGLQYGDKQEIDHINHNGLDNRRCNLRVCTHRQNGYNQTSKTGSSKYKGVSWYKPYKKWESYIDTNGKRQKLGYFDNEIDAAKAYNDKAKELFGEFACLNKIL